MKIVLAFKNKRPRFVVWLEGDALKSEGSFADDDDAESAADRLRGEGKNVIGIFPAESKEEAIQQAQEQRQRSQAA